MFIMADIANIDPDFEPQSRPRSCTWPMKRPNIGNQADTENDISMKLEPTIEEVDAQDHLMIDSVLSSTMANIKQNTEDNLMFTSGFPPTDFGKSSTVNCMSDYTNNFTTSQSSSTAATNDLSNDNLSYMNLESLPQPNSVTVSNYGALNISGASQNIPDKANFLSETSVCTIGHPLQSVSSTTDSVVSTSPTVAKPKSSSRKNAWGNMSYADLITQGIESSPDKRLTLAQIYDWMVKNVSYFKDKGDSNSSAGWKNSIRHNLSLHAKFKRIQNEGTGKSSWWVINHDAKPGKPNRRRTTSLDTSNQKLKQSQRRALGKKSEMLKKQKSCTKRDSPQTWGKNTPGPDGLPDFDHHPLNKSLMSDYRPRTSSNASSIGGRISPPRSLLTQDLEDDGPPPLSPLSSSSYAAPTNNLDLFGRSDPFNTLVGDFESMQSTGELQENYSIDSGMTHSPNNKVNMYLNSTQSSQSPFSREPPLYMQQIGASPRPSSAQQLQGASNPSTNPNQSVLSTPNLASLLQQSSGNQQSKFQTLANKSPPQSKLLSGVDASNSVPRARANTMPKLQPQPKYDMSESMRRQQSGESSAQGPLLFSSCTASKPQQLLPASPENSYIQYQYGPSRQQAVQALRPQAQEALSSAANQNKTIFQLLGQQRNGVTNSHHSPQLGNQQGNSMTLPDQHMEGSAQMPSYPSQTHNGSRKLESNSKFLTDLDSIDNQDMFDPGPLDIEQMLQEIRSPENDSFGMEFNSYFPQESFDSVGPDNSITPLFSEKNNLTKINEGPSPAYPYPSHRGNTDPNYLQQHRYSQPFNTQASNEVPVNELMIGTSAPSSASVLLPRPAPSGLGSHFNHGRSMIRAQSSMGAISDYHM